jgi:hypothetical protein
MAQASAKSSIVALLSFFYAYKKKIINNSILK